ncbi:MAG: DUF3830 family protein [Anaerolineae bacterium]
MPRIKIEFQKGGTFTAKLFEDQAPKTCAAVLKRLPFECKFWQSICSGHAVVTVLSDLTAPPENQRTVGIYPGTLCFLPQDPPKNVPDEIYITYGPYFVSRCSYIDFQQPVNVFGQIEGDADELMKVGQRILMEGAEMVRFTQLEP